MSDWRLELGDCLDVLPGLAEGSADAVVTDPPYGLEFMGAEWDSFRIDGGKAWSTTKAMTDGPDWRGQRRKRQRAAYPRSFVKRCRACGKQEFSGSPCKCPVPDWEIIASAPRQLQAFQAWCEQWAAACLRVLKPGGYLLAFGGTRTFHRLACALEDAGFEMRDTLCWLYGTGFPKGPGCLKPSWEPVLLCRRPGPRVLPLGVDGCRVEAGAADDIHAKNPHTQGGFGHGDAQVYGKSKGAPAYDPTAGRWPANVVLSPDPEVLGAFAAFGSKDTRDGTLNHRRGDRAGYREGWAGADPPTVYGDQGSAARFYFTAKAGKGERWVMLKCDCQTRIIPAWNHVSDGPCGPTAATSPARVCASCGGRVVETAHPCVKPLSLVRWLVKLVSAPGGLVLDPFCGSGTAGVACSLEGRRFLGVEREPSYHAIALARLRAEDARYPLFAAGG